MSNIGTSESSQASSEINNSQTQLTYLRRTNGVHDQKSDTSEEENESEDEKESHEPTHKIIKIGDRVRIAHMQCGCRCELSNLKDCPLEFVVDHMVGKFGVVQLIKDKDSAYRQIVEYTMAMEIGTTVSLKLDDMEDSLWKELPSVDVINYTLLGQARADKLFEDTRDKPFDNMKRLCNPDIILNEQMKTNMLVINDVVKIAKMEAIVECFQEQAHSHFHRIMEFYVQMNRRLRIEAHTTTIVSRNNEETINALD
jgi:hypothetical protein